MPDSKSLHLLAAEVEALCDALDGADSLPLAMTHIDAARRAWVGNGVLSVNVNVEAPERRDGEVLLQRVWTSDPRSYPVGGRKHKRMTPWTRTLVVDHKVYRTEGEAAVNDTFDDHALMASLGLYAALNIPIVGSDKLCVAIFNFMGAQIAWTAEQVAALRILATLARPWILDAAAKVPHVVQSKTAPQAEPESESEPEPEPR
jgi:hypothetical protein